MFMLLLVKDTYSVLLQWYKLHYYTHFLDILIYELNKKRKGLVFMETNDLVINGLSCNTVIMW